MVADRNLSALFRQPVSLGRIAPGTARPGGAAEISPGRAKRCPGSQAYEDEGALKGRRERSGLSSGTPPGRIVRSFAIRGFRFAPPPANLRRPSRARKTPSSGQLPSELGQEFSRVGRSPYPRSAAEYAHVVYGVRFIRALVSQVCIRGRLFPALPAQPSRPWRSRRASALADEAAGF